MKKWCVLFMIVIFFSHLAAGQIQEHPKAKTAVVEKKVTCRFNPAHSYQVYIPSVEKGSVNLPLLVLIDPHGNGQLAVEKFKETAQKYQVVVVGSNLVRNNDFKFIAEIEELIDDVKGRYPVGNTLYLGGFSGGARMALGYAINHRTEGVLTCGALAQEQEIRSLTCRVMCLIGMEDFNFIETAPFVLNPLEMPSNLAIEVMRYSHDWPAKETLDQAFGYLMFSAESTSMSAEKRIEVKNFAIKQKERIDMLEKNGEYLQAVLIARNMMLGPLTNQEINFMSLTEGLMDNPAFGKQVSELNNHLQLETKVRNSYYNALTQQDSLWWKHEIGLLNNRIREEKNKITRQTWQRIKNFLGIVCYTMSSQFVTQKDAPNLEKILKVYRLVEPENAVIPQFNKVLEQLKKY